MAKKRIAVAVTNRTNYSKLKLVLLELRKYEEIELYIVASSSILLERYGTPYEDLEADGFEVAMKLDCLLMNDSHEAMVNSVGLALIQHSSCFQSRRPDMLLIVGDRFDAMAPAFAAALMNIPIAHIQGGETSGSIDDRIRDIISTIATLHFVATPLSKQRLHRWGIEPESVFDYGCPAVEYISTLDVGETFDPSRIRKKFKRPWDIGPQEEYFLVMVHPDTTNEHDVSMDVLLNAVSSFNTKTLVFYPNVDTNNSNILADIARHRGNSKFYTIRHMPLEGFVHVMAHSRCMIGNSSAGIREAASFGVPVINFGDRQRGRERNTNVVDVAGEHDSLVAAIAEARTRKFSPENLYFRPNCSEKIAARMVESLGCAGALAPLRSASVTNASARVPAEEA